MRARLPDGVALRDLGAVRLRDLAQPEHVFQVAASATCGASFPALRSLEATPNNLPQQLTSFIGRERELARSARPAARTRGCSRIFGIGGLGKSRLSLQVAADVLDDYPDGVWFVELAPIADPRLVPQAVASVLGVKEDAGAASCRTRCRRSCATAACCSCSTIASTSSQACAELARALLEAGPAITILATSRERLSVARRADVSARAAARFRVRAQRSRPDALAQFAAVRLFVERAARGAAGVRAHARQRARRRRDLPAARRHSARARARRRARARDVGADASPSGSPTASACCAGGDRTALPRQQTLRALIDWSYDLLDRDERVLFRRLSVFAGGFTLEAAEASAAAAPLARERRARPARAARREVAGRARRRARSLSGCSRPCASTATRRWPRRTSDAATSDRHLAYFAGVGERARQELTGPAQASWLARLDRERENILAALRWSERVDGQAVLGLQLLASLKFYWIKRGLLHLGHRLTSEALVRTRAAVPDLARCRGLLAAGQLALAMGRYDTATAHLRQGLGIARNLRSPPAVSALLPALATAAMGQGDLAAARGLLTESLVLARDGGNRRAIVVALHELAQLDRLEGKPDAARQGHEEALRIARELDDRESIALALLGLSTLALATANPARAAVLLREVHAIVGELGSLTLAHTHFDVTAALAASSGLESCSARLLGAADAIAATTGMHRHPADESLLDQLVSRGSGRITDEAWRAASAQGRSMEFSQAMQEAAACLLELEAGRR